jgi:hypothetical protein
VSLDLFVFVWGECPAFAEDCVGNTDLADVVQQGGVVQSSALFGAPCQASGELFGELGYPSGVLLCGRVLGIDGTGERTQAGNRPGTYQRLTSRS